jgi:16S rRNA (cytidine1402-2'-O)-methyltransferase
VLVVAAAPPGAGAPDMPERALAALRAVVEAGARPRPAAKALSELTGVPANRLYRELTADEGARSG